jgi:cyclase
MRFIARLDIKDNCVIKGINFEGLRKVGEPSNLLKKYYEDGADEIIIIDAVASLYERNNIFNIIEVASKDIFIPITLGGGIRSLKDIEKALNVGADKVAINTYATENPKFIKEAVLTFGASTIMINIEAKKVRENNWEVYKNYGREKTGLELLDWIRQVQDLGCGEILVTSIDFEGLQNGFDINLIKKIKKHVKVPLIISGGCGSKDHIDTIKKTFKNISISAASALHYNKFKIQELKK